MRSLLFVPVLLTLFVACGSDSDDGGSGGSPATGGSGGAGGGTGGGAGTGGAAGETCTTPVVPPNGMGSCAGGGNHVSFPPTSIDCQKTCAGYKQLCAAGCVISPFDFCDDAACQSECDAGKTGFGFGNALAGCAADSGSCVCLKACLNAACGDLPPI